MNTTPTYLDLALQPSSGRSIADIFGAPTGPSVYGTAPAPIAATFAERTSAEAYARAVAEINESWAAKFAERAAAEIAAAEVKALRWYGDAETTRVVRNWRGRYGEDDRDARGARAWAPDNAGWSEAFRAARQRLDAIPSRAEQYRLAMSFELALPSQAIGNVELRRLVSTFLRADAMTGGALVAAEDILGEDRWTPMHRQVRTYLKRLSVELTPDDAWDAECIDALIKRARAGRTHERERLRENERAANYLP